MRTWILLFALAGNATAQSTWYVDDDAPSGGDGRTWSTAFGHFEDALGVAQASDEVRLAGGDYRKGNGLPFDVGTIRVRGGFRGLAGGGNADDRDPTAFVTSMGKMNTSDGTDVDGISSSGLASTAGTLTVTDCAFENLTDFSSTGGAAAFLQDTTARFTDCRFINCNAGGFDYLSGGAIYGVRSTITLAGCLMMGCHAEGGAALYGSDCSLDLVRCEVSSCGDVVALTRGAIELDGGDACTITDCTFDFNEWSIQAAVYSNAALTTIRRSRFEDNSCGSLIAHATTVAAEDCRFARNYNFLSIEEGGGSIARCRFDAELGLNWTSYYASSDLVIADSLFVGSTCCWSIVQGGDTNLLVERCTFADNAFSDENTAALAVVDARSTATVEDCIFWNNSRAGIGDEAAQIKVYAGSLAIDFSDVAGWTGGLGGTGNFAADPDFVDAASGDYRLSAGSPCVEVGNPAFVPAVGSLIDLDGNCRLLDAQLDRSPRLDIGCCEFSHVRLSTIGDPVPGATVQIVSDGTVGLDAFLFVGVADVIFAVKPLGTLFVDLASPYFVLPLDALPSSVDEEIPTDLDVPVTFYLQELALSASSGNLSNVVRLDLQ